MKKKLVSVLLCAVMTAGLLAGCGSNAAETQKAAETEAPAETASAEEAAPAEETAADSGDTVLEFYHGYFQDDWQPAVNMRAIYDEFAKANPGFKAVPIQTGNQGVADKVTNEVASGSFPSMVDLAGANVLEAAINSNLVLDLKPFIDEDSALKEGVGDVNYEQNQVNGAIYTVRDQIETQGFWYNEAIFMDAGAALPAEWASWEDFTAAMQKIRDAGYTAYMLEEYSSQRLAGAWMASTQAGRDMLNGLPVTFDDDDFRATLQALAAEIKANGEKNIAATGDAYRDDFFKGSPVGTPKVAVCFNGVWDAGSAVGSEFKADIKPATFPGGDKDAAKRFSYASAGAGYAISAGLTEEQQEMAVKFLKYMMSEEVQTKILTTCEANPGSNAIDHAKLLTDPDATDATKMLIEACQNANATTYKSKTIGNAWGNDIAKALSGEMLTFPSASDIDAAVDNSIQVLNSLIL